MIVFSLFYLLILWRDTLSFHSYPIIGIRVKKSRIWLVRPLWNITLFEVQHSGSIQTSSCSSSVTIYWSKLRLYRIRIWFIMIFGSQICLPTSRRMFESKLLESKKLYGRLFVCQRSVVWKFHYSLFSILLTLFLVKKIHKSWIWTIATLLWLFWLYWSPQYKPREDVVSLGFSGKYIQQQRRNRWQIFLMRLMAVW